MSPLLLSVLEIKSKTLCTLLKRSCFELHLPVLDLFFKKNRCGIMEIADKSYDILLGTANIFIFITDKMRVLWVCCGRNRDKHVFYKERSYWTAINSQGPLISMAEIQDVICPDYLIIWWRQMQVLLLQS